MLGSEAVFTKPTFSCGRKDGSWMDNNVGVFFIYLFDDFSFIRWIPFMLSSLS